MVRVTGVDAASGTRTLRVRHQRITGKLLKVFGNIKGSHQRNTLMGKGKTRLSEALAKPCFDLCLNQSCLDARPLVQHSANA